ncbi:MAG: hypothetical protein WCC01_06175, partial [Acidimicrobiia bacterium]
VSYSIITDCSDSARPDLDLRIAAGIVPDPVGPDAGPAPPFYRLSSRPMVSGYVSALARRACSA